MSKFHTLSAAVALAGVLSIPALAATQAVATAPQAPMGTTAAQTPTLMTGAGATRATGTLHETHGMWRSAALVGATVYNGAGTSIGEISNLLVSPTGRVTTAVLSVGGFLGMGTKLVAVPYNALQFVPSHDNGNTTGVARTEASPAAGAVAPANTGAPATMAAGTAPAPNQVAMARTGTNHAGPAWAARVNYSVILPNSTKASLTKMPAFTYRG